MAMKQKEQTMSEPMTPRPNESVTGLKPVRADYEPAYPHRLSGQEIDDLLRPTLFERFGPATLVAGAVVAAALAGGGCDGGPATSPSSPGGGGGGGSDTPGGAGQAVVVKSTRTDPKLKARVDQ